MYLNTRDEILELLRRAVSGLVTLDKLQKRFEYLFLDREAWPALEHSDDDFFSLILEKLSWTAENPSQDEIDLGWMNFESFQIWLKEALEKYLKELKSPDRSAGQ